MLKNVTSAENFSSEFLFFSDVMIQNKIPEQQEKAVGSINKIHAKWLKKHPQLWIFLSLPTLKHCKTMTVDKEKYISAFRSKFESYAPISGESWSLIKSIIQFQTLEKGEVLLRGGQSAKNFHFICRGALRAYITDPDGNIYNKNIFFDGDYAGSKVSLLQDNPSEFTIEALEESVLISFNYRKYREFIQKKEDLKDYYIAYLEKNWVIEKEQVEVSLVMKNATERYLKLLQEHPDIDKRIPQLHIAAHLGITPTQLSRIRKNLKKLE